MIGAKIRDLQCDLRTPVTLPRRRERDLLQGHPDDSHMGYRSAEIMIFGLLCGDCNR